MLPAEHLDFYRSLRECHREGGYFFAHGGIKPGVPLASQCGRDLMWIRAEFLESDEDHGAVIVHGHSIAPEPQVRHNRIGIDTGAYESGVLHLPGGRLRARLSANPDETASFPSGEFSLRISRARVCRACLALQDTCYGSIAALCCWPV